VIRKLRRRRPPPERELPSSELIPFYSVADAQRYALDQALASEPRGLGARHQPDSAAVIASLFAANALAWCRFLNAFPESDFAVPLGEHRGWIQVGDDQFLYTDGTGCGRSGRALPPDVDPASVPRVSLDTSAAPGRDALQAGIDRVRRELARGWAVDDADEVVGIAQGVLDREATVRAYGERYKSLCEAAARWVLEGITAERRHLDDATLADRMRTMSLHGLSHDAWGRYSGGGSWDYQIVDAGYKYNLTDIAAAIGVHQIERAEAMRVEREALAHWYLKQLSDVGELELPTLPDNRILAWHLFPIRLRLNQLSIDRNAFIVKLREQGVGCSVHWRPLHLHPYYRERFGWMAEDFPVASPLWERLVSLPLFPGISDAERGHVVRVVRQLCAAHRA
jgi:hypothetical protein